MFSASPCAKAKRRALLLSVHDKEMIPMYSLVGLVLIAFPGPKDEVITPLKAGGMSTLIFLKEPADRECRNLNF